MLDYPFADLPAPGKTLSVAEGVHWLRMPLPFALDHINLWLLEDGTQLVPVDTGIGQEPIKTHWASVLAAHGDRSIERILITHCHPDHLGLAAWLSARCKAELWMTQGEYLGGHAFWHRLPGHHTSDMLQQFRRHGLDEVRCDALEARGNAYRKGVPEMPERYRRIFDGDEILINGRIWRVMVGYGHSPEHASFYCEALGVLISGDMLLPRISTNVSVLAATPHDDPLGRFLSSLQRNKVLPDDTLVLPSHGKPFRGIAARVAQLIDHHAARCDELLAACNEPRSACELLTTLFPRALDTHQVMFAMGEAIAHLNHLVQQGKMRGIDDGDGYVRYVTSA